MSFIIYLTLLVTCFTSAALAIPKSRVEINNKIIIEKLNQQIIIPKGIDIEDCGSGGIISEVRVSECPVAPCQLHPGHSYVIEVDFSTSTNGNLWRVLVTAVSWNTSVIVLDENVDAEIEAGDKHTLQYELPVTDIFAGKSIVVQIQLIEVNTKVQEICVTANCIVSEIVPTSTENHF